MVESAEPQLTLAESTVNEELLPIGEVVRQTGVNPVTLRAWERRYGLVQPLRTEGGHRLYSPADVANIRDIMAWTERGVAVSKVGSLLARRKEEAGTAAAPLATEAYTADQQQVAEWQAGIRKALQAFDEERLEQLYGQVLAIYPLPLAFADILLPIWREAMADSGFGMRSQWLFFDSFLRSRLIQRLYLHRREATAEVILAAFPGQAHELELLVSAVLLSGDGSRIRALPLGQPLEELPVVCQAVQPAALVLLTTAAPTQAQFRQLSKLVLSVECPVALAGIGAELAQEQLQGSPIATLGALPGLMRDRLRQLMAGHLDT